jgi:hypothetical protein
MSLLALPLISPAGDSAQAAADRGAKPRHTGHHHGRRVGGSVRGAWPASGKAPRTAVARWLARQVGAAKPHVCTKHGNRCGRPAKAVAGGKGKTLRAVTARLSTVAGDPGSPSGELAQLATTRAPSARGRATASANKTPAITLPLKLVRSYEIPVGDPSYTRLLNWSWTYDSAVSAAAFASIGAQANSAQLLDQLSALQYTNGSIDIAFNTDNGEGAGVFRSGTGAWVGLAAATYDQAFNSDRYLETEQRLAGYLLSLQGPTGLIKGGPDVTWTSTQHNLIAYVFLSRLAKELEGAGNPTAAAPYQAAASTIAAAINTNLLVVERSSAHFLQGLNDPTQTLDVQALGAMFLQGTGQKDLATQVLAYAQSNFAIANRSVKLSADRATYNMTYSANGPFSGYAPYAGSTAPDVLWAEGSGEMRLAEASLGQDTSALDKSIAGWAAITPGQGPLQSDKTVTSNAYEGEYHVWPASTTAAWTVLAQSAPAFFAAPLPPSTSLVNGWAKVRGGNLITTTTNGQVEMLTGGGERRVLAGSATGTNYTVTANATLLNGAGYGVYVRSTVDAAAKLTGYCVQMDHGYGVGQIVVRELIGDNELSVPIAHVAVPTGFVWYGVPHTVAVDVNGNTMKVSLDGAPVVNMPDLATASAASVKYNYPTTTLPAPAAGGYGLRAWGDGLVGLQQMTVGPAS